MSDDEQASTDGPQATKPATPTQLVATVVVALLVISGLFLVFYKVPEEELKDLFPATNQPPAIAMPGADQELEPRSLGSSSYTNRWGNDHVLWWDDVPEGWLARRVDTGTNSNIRLQDLAGSDSCQSCHADNYAAWTKHGHSRMTTHASAATVVGDFSGSKSIDYEGGTARFFKDGEKFLMELKRSNKTWLYQVTRTIGWRHDQSYAGYLIKGPDLGRISRNSTEHVLPFAFDVGEQHWMPAVHIFRDDDIPDSFEPHNIAPYVTSCADCHMAYPVGDRMIRRVGIDRWAAYAPRQSSMFLAAYFADAHAGLMEPGKEFKDYSDKEVVEISTRVRNLHLERMVPLQGITCEACHYGCKEHVDNSTKENSKVLPAFFPVSPHLVTEAESTEELRGKNNKNVNFMCARCHSGSRTHYANGLHSWNSTEYTEAINGHCYDHARAEKAGMESLTCVHCHNPHETIGLQWTRPPANDDARCIKCHDKYNDSQTRLAHTHHASGDGSHCMDCHMPHTNEGLNRMVRTHRIINPIDHLLIEANQVNACNLCHLDKSINWTIDNLKQWYRPDLQFDETKMAKNYQSRTKPVVHEWMNSPHTPTRIATAGAIARRKAYLGLPDLLDQLASENIGHALRVMQKSADNLLGLKLRDKGFLYWHSLEQRQAGMRKLKPELIEYSVKKQTEATPAAASR